MVSRLCILNNKSFQQEKALVWAALVPTCKLEVCEADEAEDCPEEGLDCLEEV